MVVAAVVTALNH